MLLFAIVLFAIAATLGIYLLSFVLDDKNTPKGVALTHGPIAVVGIVILICYAVFYKPAPISALIIFVLAAMGGLVFFYRDLTGKSLPKWLAIGHGVTAILGFLFLLYFIFFTKLN